MVIYPVVAAEYERMLRCLGEAKDVAMVAGTESLRKRAALLGEKMERLSNGEAALEVALQGKHEDILTAMQHLRTTVDELEKLVADPCWPLPKYREMLFIY